MSLFTIFVVSFAGAGLALVIAALAALLLAKPLFAHTVRAFVKRILTDPYHENLWTLINSLRRVGAGVMVETSLRAETGRPIERPLGSIRRFPGFDSLSFSFAQLKTKPLDGSVVVNLTTIIGPRAQKPLRLALPVQIAGMAWGLSLSDEAAIALAMGASGAGTSVNSGEGPLLPAMRQAADLLVLQWNRGTWAKDDATLAQVDAVEIQVGQGARGARGFGREARGVDERVRTALGVTVDERVTASATLPEAPANADLARLVRKIRAATGGVPVGVKLAAGQNLEGDLEAVLSANVDFITLCGAEGGTYGSPPCLEDDFGLPLLYALVRADRFLRARDVKGSVSLIADGGLCTPGDFLKAIALGADAVSIGGVALIALSHDQVVKTIPWEPPSQLVYFGGKNAAALDIRKAGRSLAKFLLATREEMAEGLRVLGKSSLMEISASDLVALDRGTARLTGAPFGGDSPRPRRVRTVSPANNSTVQPEEDVNTVIARAPIPLGEWVRRHKG